MKKPYSKLKTDRVLVSTESGVMSCSTRVEIGPTVHDYTVYEFAGTKTFDNGESAWEVGFEE